MTDTDYKEILDKAKSDLLKTQNELGETYKEQETLEKKITGLRATIAALARMLDEEFVEEDAMGLTDAIREAFRAIGTSGNLTPMEVKGKLEMMGYDTAKYGNVMASVHTIINRLAAKGEIKHVATRGDNKPAYQITPRMLSLAEIAKSGDAAMRAAMARKPEQAPIPPQRLGKTVMPKN